MVGNLIPLPRRILLEHFDLLDHVDPLTLAGVARTLRSRPNDLQWMYDEMLIASFAAHLGVLTPKYARTLVGQREVAAVLDRVQHDPPDIQPVIVRPPPGPAILANETWLVAYQRAGFSLVPVVVAVRK